MGFILLTMTAMPSVASTTDCSAAASFSFSSRDAMPRSYVPFIAPVMPAVESLNCRSIVDVETPDALQ